MVTMCRYVNVEDSYKYARTPQYVMVNQHQQQQVKKPLVDEWDTEENPIDERDRIFKNIKGEIILPINQMILNNGSSGNSSLDYFVMSTKRSYNSDETRDHICRYLNYFIKYYDQEDKELIAVLLKIKINIDYIKNYNEDNFFDDVNRYIIRNSKLRSKITNFVEDNYRMKLSSNNNKTPNLQFNDKHAKILYEISLLMNMYIPLATHYMFIHNITRRDNGVKDFMLSLFNLCNIKYVEERNIDIFNKIYETAVSVVNKSKNPDKPLWEKNQIRGNNTTTHTEDSVVDIIMNIIPKYTYDNSIINFNYYSNRQCLKYKITDIKYEYPFCKMSSSKRDADQNSEYDRYEARQNKKDEAISLQNKVAAEQTVRVIEAKDGPFSEKEIAHYKKRLSRDGAPLINSFQKKLIGYMFYKEFGDPKTLQAIPNQTDYIKLIIAAKRRLLNSGMILLPYIISGRIERIATRKIISKKDLISLEADKLYEEIKMKYNNEKIEQHIYELIASTISSSYEIIDWDEENEMPGKLDGKQFPMYTDIVKQELMCFIENI